MFDFGMGPPSGCFLLCATILVLIPSRGGCAEFTFFKLTDASGALKLEYSLDEKKIDKAKGLDLNEQRITWEEELTLATQSYIFHPNLLLMDLSGGVRFDQKRVKSDLPGNSSRETVYDFSGKWSFFNYKSYPFNLYYRLSHPTQSVGIADSLDVQQESYGMDVFLRRPLVSAPVRLLVDHSTNSGENTTRIIDTSMDSVSLRVSFDITENGRGNVALGTTSQKSASGSKSLPIQETRSDIDSFRWDSNVHFGEQQNASLRNYLTLSSETRTNADQRDQANFYNHLMWELDDTFKLYNTYSYTGVDFVKNKTDSHTLSVGARKELGESWIIGSDLEASRETANEFNLIVKKVTGNLNYMKEINDRWNTNAAYSTSLTISSQVTEQLVRSVYDESHVLSGLTDVSLGSEYIVPGSIVVYNLTHSQTYIENADYRVTVVGTETRIERLAAGNIVDGETVLVDYDYELDGSYDYQQINQSLSLRYTLDRRFGFFANYNATRPKLLAGTSDRDLIAIETYSYGTDGWTRVSQISQISWSLEFQRRLTDLNPFKRGQIGLNYSTGLPFYSGFASLDSEYEYQDNENSPIDVQQTSYRARFSFRPTWRSTTSLELSYRKDTGGEIFKDYSDSVLRYDWARAQLAFSLIGKSSIERQGETKREDKSVNASLIRRFR